MQLAKLRRWQIRCVAIGSSGCLMFLLGLSLQVHIMAWIGVAVFIMALLLIFILGGWAWWRFG